MNGTAWSGHGEMAFVSRDELYVLDNAGSVTKVLGPAPGGSYGSPAWSTDGSWLAFTYTTPPPGEEAGNTETGLWVVRAGAPDAEQVALTGVGEFAWSPTTSLVLAFESLDPETNTTTLWEDVPGHRATAVPGITPFFGGFAWSPDGTRLAVSTGHAGNGHGIDLLSTLEVIPTGGGTPVTWYQTTSDVIEVASWWPNGRGLLYWLDTDGSSSVAADGLVLYTQAAGSPPRPLATTLVDTSWLTWSPDGTTLALVAGGSRTIWEGDKHVEICDPVTAACTSVDTPPGTVSLSPTWSPTGVLSFLAAAASDPFGADGRAYFSQGWMAEWDMTHALFVSGSEGSSQLTDAGTGVVAAQWGPGDVLTVTGDYLWLAASGDSTPTRIAGPLSSTVAPTGYYGEVNWDSMFAWHSS